MKNGWTELSEKYLALNERYEKAISLLESAADKLQFNTPSGRNDSLSIEIYEFLEEQKQTKRGYNDN